MKKLMMLLKESYLLVKKHKFYFLLPLLICLAFLALLAFHIGPGIVISFIYAGV